MNEHNNVNIDKGVSGERRAYMDACRSIPIPVLRYMMQQVLTNNPTTTGEQRAFCEGMRSVYLDVLSNAGAVEQAIKTNFTPDAIEPQHAEPPKKTNIFKKIFSQFTKTTHPAT